jgi:hypothetical protein
MSEIELHSSLNVQMEYAKALSSADLLPSSYRNKPANILLAMGYGRAIGLDPVTAIQQIHVIEGKPTASAGLIGGLVRKAGHRLRVTGDDKRAVAEIIRSDDKDFTFRSEWTIERAVKANLTNKGVWKSYPANMLKARAITEVARDACPEVLAGVAYTPEELGEDDVRTKSTIGNDNNEWLAVDTPVQEAEIVEPQAEESDNPWKHSFPDVPECKHGKRGWSTGLKKDGRTPWGQGWCGSHSDKCEPIWYLWSKTNEKWMTQAELGAQKAREALAKEDAE